ncbi:hypothetical protein, partial [Pseudomonas sp. NPDC096950]|uniref:hypothetical protein n=1 Tax=Pseudomonas sp. NPDC096950 TaxID=3364485 RepID=UPI00383B2F53
MSEDHELEDEDNELEDALESFSRGSVTANYWPRIIWRATIRPTNFYVRAEVMPGYAGALQWELKFWGSANINKTFGAGDSVRFDVPEGAIGLGTFQFAFRYFLSNGGWSNWNETRVLTMPTPEIVDPAIDGIVRTKLHEFWGRGSPGAKVTLYHANMGHLPLGDGTVNTLGLWKFTSFINPLWQADPFTFVALHSLNGELKWTKEVRVPVLFKPVIANVVMAGLKPTVVGAGGLAGARIEVWNAGGGGGVLMAATVMSNGTWQVASTSDWLVGQYTITTRQIAPVSGSDSDWSDNLSFTIIDPKPPKPAITPIAQPIEGRHALTITGVAAGTVTLTMLTDAGGVVAGTFTGSGASRTFTPTAAWTPPGEKKVKVVQTVGGVPSDPSDVVTLKVKPPKPAITPIAQPIEGRHALTITGALPGVVNLMMQTGAGVRIDGAYSPVSGGGYTFTPTEAWPPGAQTVKVVQAVNGVSSDPSDVVTLKVKPPKPAITPITQPIEGRHALTITGVAAGTVTLTLQTGAGGAVAGTFSGSGTTRTFTPTASWTPPGEQMVKVVQTVGGVASDASDLVTLKVKPGKPAITLV